MTARILVPGRLAGPGVASRHPVVYAGVRYAEALHRAGGEALVVAPRSLDADDARGLLAGMDALVLIGGADVNAERYGSTPGAHDYPVNPVEDTFEMALVDAAVEMRLPTLAVCRGLQVANVALGGTLAQHIPDLGGTVAHAVPGFPQVAAGTIGPRNQITLTSDCRLAAALGATVVRGACSHHQAIDALGDGLRVVGRAEDGVIEAVEHDAAPLLAVQWHPEDTAATDPQQQRIFDTLVAHALAGDAA